MTTVTVHIRVAVRKTRKRPYKVARLLGSRAKAQPGEVVVPMALQIDEQWFERELARVWVEVTAPANPTAEVEGVVS